MIAGETSSDVMAHFGSGAAVVYTLQYLKHAGWCPKITDDTKKLNLIVSAVMAIGIGFGVTGHWTPDDGGYFHIPKLAELIANGFDAGKQFLTQQVLYDVTQGGKPQPVRLHPDDLKQLALLLRDALTFGSSASHA